MSYWKVEKSYKEEKEPCKKCGSNTYTQTKDKVTTRHCRRCGPQDGPR